jgi:O-methyltransferase
MPYKLHRTFEQIAARSKWRRRTAKFISQEPFAGNPRQMLIRAFDQIDRNVPHLHARGELLFIAERLLELEIEGPIVECGCFKGASAAKLSLVARLAGRSLYVCDSFAGLPQSTEQHYDSRRQPAKFKAGDYCGTENEVRENIARWGALDVCTFVKGWLGDTLPGLDISPALVFMDVDYVSSARDCLRSLWPRLQPSGYFFTHEMKFPTFVDGITDGEWWHSTLNQCPPTLYGAIHAQPVVAIALGYFRKPARR